MGASTDVSFGFTVGPVMPAAEAGAAGDRERYREMLEDCRFGQSLGFGSVWVLEHYFTDYYPSPSPLLFLSHVAAACPGLGLLCTSASPFQQNADSIGAWKAVTAANGGRADANDPLWIHCFVADNEADARDEATRYLAAFFRAVIAHYETHANPWKDVPTYERNVQQMERMEAMADPANLPPFLEHQLVGTPEQVAAPMRRYREIGVTQFAINTAQPGRPALSRHRCMERFAREVIPLV